ncbi:MAG: response regulator transcription factor [Clostridia bacterium]|nr:response regulator transcription factor [Clostridia bacterium]
MLNILVVEDDKNTRKLITTILGNYGYSTLEATNGVEALDVLDHNHVDLMVLDVMMPKMDGYELAKTLRDAGSQMPMLMLSAKNNVADIKQGFVVGIDDYLTKPFDFEELLLRIKALLRRSKIVAENKLVIGSVTLDYNSYSVIVDGASETLPQKEFLLLYKLLSYPDMVFTRMQLMDEIWGMDAESDDHTVNVHINRLRTRFANIKEFEIVTIRGLGYKAVRHDE